MHLKINLLLVLVVMMNNVYSQNLFLLKATPYEDPYEFDSEFSAGIFRYKPDSLKLEKVLNLAAYDNRVQSIQHYYNENLIVIQKKTKKFDFNMTIINTAKFDTLLITKAAMCPAPYSYMEYKIFNTEKEEKKFCFKCWSSEIEKKIHLKGENLYDNNGVVEFYAENYKNIILSGTLVNSDYGDYLRVVSEPNNGNLRIPVTNKIDERPIFPLILPEPLQLGEKRFISILINNKNQFVLHLDFMEHIANQLGQTRLAIFDYTTQEWHQLTIKGNQPNINSYGDWLAGTVSEYTGRDYDTNEESPGKKEREALNSQNEFNAEKRFAYFRIFKPGILYVFNTSTKKYIEWETEQGDSEILLIHNQDIYYRVNDEIYVVPIINGEKLGKETLLIKDIEVLDIHWGFISDIEGW